MCYFGYVVAYKKNVLNYMCYVFKFELSIFIYIYIQQIIVCSFYKGNVS